MPKQIQQNKLSRETMKRGVDTLADIVKVTLGPKGRNVVIEKEWGEPDINQDGVTVARAIDLKDRFENMGAKLIKSASIKTNDEAGDGTTTAVVLAQEMISKGMKYTELGMSVIGIKKGIKKGVKSLVEELKKISVDIKDNSQLVNVATISAKDSDIGKMIAEAMNKVGKTGILNVEKGNTNDIVVEMVEGFRFDKGFVSPYMITDREKRTGEFNNGGKGAYILITDKAISDMGKLIPILEKLAQQNTREIVIICGDIQGDALASLIVNNVKGSYHSLVIKAPYYGDKQKAFLQDVAILTGGTVITQDLSLELEAVEISHLGRARKVESTKDHTTIIEGAGEKEAVKLRIDELQKELDSEKSEFNKENLRDRLGKLSGVVGIIKVGANSETEQRDLELRIEDAISATQAALEEGIVIGGGTALIRARQNSKLLEDPTLTANEKKGVEIVFDAVEKPFKQILENGGLKSEVIMNDILNSDDKDFGYNAETESYVSMKDEGIIDPTKVVRCALENASSIAEMFLTVEATICLEDIPEPKMQ
jgi:chaperonin GroEL